MIDVCRLFLSSGFLPALRLPWPFFWATHLQKLSVPWLALEKCSAPCNSSVRLPPFLPIILAAAESGESLLGCISVSPFVVGAGIWTYYPWSSVRGSLSAQT